MRVIVRFVKLSVIRYVPTYLFHQCLTSVRWDPVADQTGVELY